MTSINSFIANIAVLSAYCTLKSTATQRADNRQALVYLRAIICGRIGSCRDRLRLRTVAALGEDYEVDSNTTLPVMPLTIVSITMHQVFHALLTTFWVS
jgi:hypothetical protein